MTQTGHENANVLSATAESIFQSSLPLDQKLDKARTELLDLSARNRLLNMPRSAKGSRSIEIVDEKSVEVLRMLVTAGKAFTFAAGRTDAPESERDAAVDSEADEIEELAQPGDDSVDERGVFVRHVDTRLQTRLTSKGLQKRLLDLYFDARTIEEEQGVNILFLTFGALKWIDPNNATNERYAPLVLVPVALDRATAAERFKLRCRPEEPATNLSLQLFLDRLHTLKLPETEISDDFDIEGYFDSVAKVVSIKPGWEVLRDHIVLGFFSFSKFLMYRDLSPAEWPQNQPLLEQRLVRGLLRDGFDEAPSALPDDANIDRHIAPPQMLHILDCDSSQTVAAHDVRSGGDLVIQGPPGTGKSQTIANIIAAAVADKKTVLFVAEKMAALDVVKRRLDAAGVGDICLELHSNKANKKAFLDELKRTWNLGAPLGAAQGALLPQLKEARDGLNAHVERLHRPHDHAQLTPYEVLGELVRLRQQGFRPVDFALPGATHWSPSDLHQRSQILKDIALRIVDIGLPAKHPWRGVGLNSVGPIEVQRLIARIAPIANRLVEAEQAQQRVAAALFQPPTQTIAAFAAIAELAHRIAGTPALEPSALSSEAWIRLREPIGAWLDAGDRSAALRKSLVGRIQNGAWEADTEKLRAFIGQLPGSFDPDGVARAAEVAERLPVLIAEAQQLKSLLGVETPLENLDAVERMTTTGRRVADAPDASPEIFAATVWDHGIEQANDLAEAVATVEKVRSDLDPHVVEAAWDVDAVHARQVLAGWGRGFFRFFNSEWRRTNRLVKSLLTQPKAPLTDVLGFLDALAKGRAAIALIRSGDAFGSSAFGADWRGDRSASAPLRAIVAWMRSLKGLGAEPRLIVSRLPDRFAVGSLSKRVQGLLGDVRRPLGLLSTHLAERATTFLAPPSSSADLSFVAQRAGTIAKADAMCRKILATCPPTAAGQLSVLEELHAQQQAVRAVAGGVEIARAAFGSACNGIDSDWEALRSAAAWIDANGDIRELAAKIDARVALAEQAALIEESLRSLKADTDQLLMSLRADWTTIFSQSSFEDLSASKIAEKFDLWLKNDEQLSKWVAYSERFRKARALELDEIVARLEDGRLTPTDAESVFEMAYYETLLNDHVRAAPELGRFDGALHGRLVDEFAALDRRRIASANAEVVREHHLRIPAQTGLGPIAVLRSQMARQRGLMPIRKLMQQAGPAVQALKPVMMMSPLSIAQFLPPGKLEFDLLVMDEASQIQPVDAIGAIARCRQVVVVGDERQLPPTRFFSKITGSQDDDDDDDGTQVAGIESILSLFVARGLPQRMLRWHYRSRHESLIAISNSQFYDNKLFIVPSPYTAEAGMGLLFHHVDKGVFDSGNTGTNMIEAQTVAYAIIAHAKNHPNLSLGVATFSVRQRKAIMEQLEVLRRLNADAETFFDAHSTEPFFIKNLENVQGDERDVIFISVGYGRNANGVLAMRFGPLGVDGGERRLNVLISRAKHRCEVFSSITDEDIDLERARGKGVFAFKLFLQFARTGRLSFGTRGLSTRETQFEIEIAKALQQRGYQVHSHIGIAGCFVDLAVADPARPGRYLLGIECDGASYRHARSARDRDRLRKSVLEDHGWIMHRVWCSDWFQRPQEQLAKVVAAIEAAKAELENRAYGAAQKRAVPVKVVTIERSEVTEIGLAAADDEESFSLPYVEARNIKPIRGVQLHDVPLDTMVDYVKRVVAIEGPVHTDEVVTRIRAGWDLARSGTRIQSAVEAGVQFAVRAKQIDNVDGFLSLPRETVKVRDRSSTESSGLRRPEMLPPVEIDCALLDLTRRNLGARRSELIQRTCRSLGFKAVGATLRELIERRIAVLLGDGRLVDRDGLLVAV